MIEVRGLCKRHGALDVLSDVNLSVAKGEVAAIVGPSGGGKSTLLRCMNGLEAFERGAVLLGDLELTAAAQGSTPAATLRAVRRKVGFVFQQFNLFAHMHALGNVAEAPVHVAGMSQASAEKEARELLAKVGLADKAAAYPHQLSGGQQQRVAIARALAMRPEILLLDEPTSALDPVMASEVMAVVSDLADAGQTMIVVTHQLGLVRSVADTVHVFAGGRRVEHGPTEAVFSAPAHSTTQGFLAKLRTT
ncbi:MAG TPA: amino acid ABC transporter ATP-binding protein [Polyangiaceae bacterium]|nr:amino acid ABC transporter ATP-binding protein [Polyangiaceae bacterium]